MTIYYKETIFLDSKSRIFVNSNKTDPMGTAGAVHKARNFVLFEKQNKYTRS